MKICAKICDQTLKKFFFGHIFTRKRKTILCLHFVFWKKYYCSNVLKTLLFKFLIVKATFSEKNPRPLPRLGQSHSKYRLGPRTLKPGHWAKKKQPGAGTRLFGSSLVWCYYHRTPGCLSWQQDHCSLENEHSCHCFPFLQRPLGSLFPIQSLRLEHRLS